MEVTAEDYELEHAKVFCDEMEELGLEPEHYEGRFHWEGPAVRVEDMSDLRRALAKTCLTCQWDDMGRGFILYPTKSAQLRKETA